MSDTAFLLEVLNDGEPHSLNEILWQSFNERGCGLTVHSRAADLRKQGYVVVNESDPFVKSSSVYRLLRRAVGPEETSSAALRSGAGLTADDPSASLPAGADNSPEGLAPAPFPGQLSLEDAA